jgi:putative Mg2+ transporter-C (MgtC) family protein
MLVARELTVTEIILRVLISVVIGGLIGLERGMKNRPAGLRTYMLVCVGACVVMLTNQYTYQVYQVGDPVRMGAQVISGIGFLGAGTIIVTSRNQIKGLTTAAGLWTAGGIGLAIGIGLYEVAIAASAAVFIILTVLHQLDFRVRKKAHILYHPR